MLIEIFFQKYNMSDLAVHKRAQIEAHHIKVEKIRKNEEWGLPMLIFHHDSHKLWILLANATWAPAGVPGAALDRQKWVKVLVMVQWHRNVNTELQTQGEQCCRVDKDTVPREPRGRATKCLCFFSKRRQDKLKYLKPAPVKPRRCSLVSNIFQILTAEVHNFKWRRLYLFFFFCLEHALHV